MCTYVLRSNTFLVRLIAGLCTREGFYLYLPILINTGSNPGPAFTDPGFYFEDKTRVKSLVLLDLSTCRLYLSEFVEETYIKNEGLIWTMDFCTVLCKAFCWLTWFHQSWFRFCV